MSIPFLDDNKNWLLPGVLCVGGCLRNDDDVELLLGKGVSTFVNLMTKREIKKCKVNLDSLEMNYIYFPIPDEGVVDDVKLIALINRLAGLILTPFVNSECPSPIYISCRGGLGRSMMVGVGVMIKLFEIVGTRRVYDILGLNYDWHINDLICFADKQKRRRKVKKNSPILTSSLQRNFLARYVGEKCIYFYDSKKDFGHFSNFFKGSKKYPMNLQLPFSYSKKISGEDTFDFSPPTTEHWFQMQKFLYTGMPDANYEYARLMVYATTPNKVANMGRQVAKGQWAGKWNVAPEEDLPLSLRGRGYGEAGGYIKAVKDGVKAGVKMRDDWGEVKDDVMMYALRAKFDQERNPELYQALLDTQGYSLREYTFRDDYWAVFGCDGLGVLGILLGRLRDELLLE